MCINGQQQQAQTAHGLYPCKHHIPWAPQRPKHSPLPPSPPKPLPSAGTLAGSTILLLSLAWGCSVLLGRCDINRQGTAQDKTLTRGWDLFNTGVTVDRDVGQGAAIMASSVLLYGIVQVGRWWWWWWGAGQRERDCTRVPACSRVIRHPAWMSFTQEAAWALHAHRQRKTVLIIAGDT